MHEIQNLNIDLSSFSIDSELVVFFKDSFPQLLEQVLDESFPESHFVLVENIDIIFDAALFNNLEKNAFKRKLYTIIKEALEKNAIISTNKFSIHELVLFFLEKGYHKFQDIDGYVLFEEACKNHFKELINLVKKKSNSHILFLRLINQIEKYSLINIIQSHSKKDSVLLKKINDIVSSSSSNESRLSIIKIYLEYFQNKLSGESISMKKYFSLNLFKIRDVKSFNVEMFAKVLDVTVDLDELRLSSVYDAISKREAYEYDQAIDYDKILKWLYKQQLFNFTSSESIHVLNTMLGRVQLQRLLKDIVSKNIESTIGGFLSWVDSFSRLLKFEDQHQRIIDYLLEVKASFNNSDLLIGYLDYLKGLDARILQSLKNYLINENANTNSLISNSHYNKLNSIALNYLLNESIFIDNEIDYSYKFISYLSSGIGLSNKSIELLKAKNDGVVSVQIIQWLKKDAFNRLVLWRLNSIISSRSFFLTLKEIWVENIYSIELVTTIEQEVVIEDEIILDTIYQYFIQNLDKISKLSTKVEVQDIFAEIKLLWKIQFDSYFTGIKPIVDILEVKELSIYDILQRWDNGQEFEIPKNELTRLNNTIKNEIVKVVEFIKTSKKNQYILLKLSSYIDFNTNKSILDYYFNSDKAYILLSEHISSFPNEVMKKAVIDNFLTAQLHKATKPALDSVEKSVRDDHYSASYKENHVQQEFIAWLNYFILTKKTLYNKSKLERLIVDNNSAFIIQMFVKVSKLDKMTVLLWFVEHLSVLVSLNLSSLFFKDRLLHATWKSEILKIESPDIQKSLLRKYIESDGEYELFEFSNENTSQTDLSGLVLDHFQLFKQYLKFGIWESIEYEFSHIVDEVFKKNMIALIEFILTSEFKRTMVLRMIYQLQDHQLNQIFPLLFKETAIEDIICRISKDPDGYSKWRYKYVTDLFEERIIIRDYDLFTTLFDISKNEDALLYGLKASDSSALLIDLLNYNRLLIKDDIDIISSIQDEKLKNDVIRDYFFISYYRFNTLLNADSHIQARIVSFYLLLSDEIKKKLWLHWYYSSTTIPLEVRSVIFKYIKNDLSFSKIEPALFFYLESKALLFTSKKMQEAIEYIDKHSDREVITELNSLDLINEVNLVEQFDNIFVLSSYLTVENSLDAIISTFSTLENSALNKIAESVIEQLSFNEIDGITQFEFESFTKEELIKFIKEPLKSKTSFITTLAILTAKYGNNRILTSKDTDSSSIHFSSVYVRLLKNHDFRLLSFLTLHKEAFIIWLSDENLTLSFYSFLTTKIGKIRAFEWLIEPIGHNYDLIFQLSKSINPIADVKIGEPKSLYDTQSYISLFSEQAVIDDSRMLESSNDGLLSYLLHSFEKNTIDSKIVESLLNFTLSVIKEEEINPYSAIYRFDRIALFTFLYDKLSKQQFQEIVKYFQPRLHKIIYENLDYWINHHKTIEEERSLEKYFFVNSIELYFNSTSDLLVSVFVELLNYRFLNLYLIHENTFPVDYPDEWRKNYLKRSKKSDKILLTQPSTFKKTEIDKLTSRLISLLRVTSSVSDLPFEDHKDNYNIDETTAKLDEVWNKLSTLINQVDLLSNWAVTYSPLMSINLIELWLNKMSNRYLIKELKRFYPAKISSILKLIKNISSILPNRMVERFTAISIYVLLSKKSSFDEKKIIYNFLLYLSHNEITAIRKELTSYDKELSQEDHLIFSELIEKLNLDLNDYDDDSFVQSPLNLSDLARLNKLNEKAFEEELPSVLRKLTYLLVQAKSQDEQQQLIVLWNMLINKMSPIALVEELRKNQSLEKWSVMLYKLQLLKLFEVVQKSYLSAFPALEKVIELAKEWLSGFDVGLSREKIHLRLWTIVSFSKEALNYEYILNAFIKTLPQSLQEQLREQLSSKEAVESDSEVAESTTKEIDSELKDVEELVDLEGVILGKDVEDEEVNYLDEKHLKAQLRLLDKFMFSELEKLIEARKMVTQKSLPIDITRKIYTDDRTVIREQLFSYLSYGHFQNVTVQPVKSFRAWLQNLDQLLRYEKFPIKKRISILAKHHSFVEGVSKHTNTIFKIWLLEWLILETVNNRLVEENIRLAVSIISRKIASWSFDDMVSAFMKAYLVHFIDASSIKLSDWVREILPVGSELTDKEIAKLDVSETTKAPIEELSIYEKIDLKEIVIEDEPIEGLIHLPYAGIVIFGPYLSRLFDLLGYLKEDKKSFFNVDKACRAVYALSLLNGRNEELNEPDYLIHKLLCGLPLALPLPPRPTFQESEVATVNSMLNGVKNNWPKMQRSSVEAMQESFINRDGTLSFHEAYWQVTIEKKTMDILLQSIPWSYAKIKLPWMDQPINVEWI